MTGDSSVFPSRYFKTRSLKFQNFTSARPLLFSVPNASKSLQTSIGRECLRIKFIKNHQGKEYFAMFRQHSGKLSILKKNNEITVDCGRL
ncbi:UNVERIFIED_CONTAM: hypothetical protein NCL1_50914 [Trichonephila clavipes]